MTEYVNNADLICKPRFADDHIKFLTGSAANALHFRLIHHHRPNDAQNLFGTLADLWPRMMAAQAEGYGVFVVANEGGHSDGDITRIRALFVDGDGIPPPKAWHHPPAFIVQRDATHWHAYWLVENMPVREFKAAQLRLAAHYGTDTKVCNPSRVMRLAGTLHMKEATHHVLEFTEWLQDICGSFAPVDVLEGLPTVQVKLAEQRKAAPGVELDHPQHIARAEAHLDGLVARGAVAIEGKGGDAFTLQVCNELLDLGCTPATGLELMLERFNDHCQPPWDDEVLEAKMANAARYRENDIGCDTIDTRPMEEVFKDAFEAERAAGNAKDKPSPFRVTFEPEMDNEPPTEWLVEDLLQTKSTAMIVGETGSYKSFLALDIALAVASGRETFGVKPKRTGAVLYAALEGLRAVKGDRRKAWRLARGIDGVLPFGTCKAPLVGDNGQCHEFINQVAAAFSGGLELIILETVNKMMAGLNENEAKDAAVLSAFCDALVEHFDCTVVVIHHKSDKVNAADVRGSSAFTANFDTVIEVSADRSTATATVKVKKQKDGGAEREQPWHFKGEQTGPSMVLEPLSEAAHKEAVKGRDIYHPSNVGGALAKLGARGAPGVTTCVLASALVEPQENETVEQREANIGAAERQLHRRAAKLQGYWEQEATGNKRRMWFLPA